MQVPSGAEISQLTSTPTSSSDPQFSSLLSPLGLTLFPRRTRLPLVGMTCVLGILLLCLGSQQLNTFKRDEDVSAYEMSQSASLRPILATVAWKMFCDRPTFGCGFGQYKQHDMNYWRDPNSDLPLEKARPYVQHNAVLALLTETGMIGTGLYLALFAAWAHSALLLGRHPQASATERQFGLVWGAFLIAFLINGMFHDNSIIPHGEQFAILDGRRRPGPDVTVGSGQTVAALAFAATKPLVRLTIHHLVSSI